MSITRSLVLLSSCFAVLLTIGCESNPSTNSANASAPRHAVVTMGANGNSTVVFLPTSNATEPVIYCTAGTDICPACKAAAVRYFQTGELEPKCPRTGAIRTLTEMKVSHQ